MRPDATSPLQRGGTSTAARLLIAVELTNLLAPTNASVATGSGGDTDLTLQPCNMTNKKRNVFARSLYMLH